MPTWAYIVLVTVLWLPVTLIGQMIVTGSNPLGDEIEHPLKDYITETTSPEDSVLIWGASSMLNFQTQRPSPSRFHYGYPLIVPGEYSQENIDQFVDDLEANQPALIVDATLNDGDRIPPLDPYIRRLVGGRRAARCGRSERGLRLCERPLRGDQPDRRLPRVPLRVRLPCDVAGGQQAGSIKGRLA